MPNFRDKSARSGDAPGDVSWTLGTDRERAKTEMTNFGGTNRES